MTPPKPTQLVTDPLIQAVFDALDAYIAGTAWTSANSSVTLDGSGTTHTMNSNDRGGKNSVSYTERAIGVTVSVQPVTANLGPGQTQQFTASAVDASGVAIAGATFTWSLSSPAHGTVSTTGLYTAPATITAAISDTLTASLDGQQAWASVTIQLHT
jgi:hypothetical protein